jgi:hypothetical protein
VIKANKGAALEELPKSKVKEWDNQALATIGPQKMDGSLLPLWHLILMISNYQ